MRPSLRDAKCGGNLQKTDSHDRFINRSRNDAEVVIMHPSLQDTKCGGNLQKTDSHDRFVNRSRNDAEVVIMHPSLRDTKCRGNPLLLKRMIYVLRLYFSK